MGLLDEAIREHLELKRKHGAGEAELREQEQEALGPIRREPASAPEPEEPAAAEAPGEEVVVEEAAAAEEAPIEHPPVEEHPFADPVAPAEVLPDPQASEEEIEEGVPGDEGWLEEEPAQAEATGDTPTRAFDAVEDPAEPGEGDVLEETPEFLEETPEHDRLWFEQKPPRDFDFDE